MRWGIRLHSKYTGEVIHLGVPYSTQEEAEAEATDEHICHRCNRVEVYRIYRDDSVYGGKDLGFNFNK